MMIIAQKDTIDEAYDELLSISKTIQNPILVVHRGDKGAAIITRSQKIYLEPVNIDDVINPTGSGDVFNGAFVYGLMENWNSEKSAEFAGKIAAIHLQDLSKIYPTLKDLSKD